MDPSICSLRYIVDRECLKFKVVSLQLRIWAPRRGANTVPGWRSREQIREELLDPLCVQTIDLAWWVGGGLHAKRTASAEVVVVEENRSRVTGRAT